MVVAEVVVAGVDAAAVWPVCPNTQAVRTATSARMTDWRYILEMVMPHNFELEQWLSLRTQRDSGDGD